MSGLEIQVLPVLKDNYIFVLYDPQEGTTAVVDPALAQPVLEHLKAKNRQLDFVLNTHHHWDHVGGNKELKSKTGCKIVGYRDDAERIPGIDSPVDEDSSFTLGSQTAEVMFVPGHTLGHIAYYFAGSNALFCGDTLFSMGCGRLFEGSPQQMWQSLQRLKKLPPSTNIYCTHEYTLDNGRFARSIDPQNQELIRRMETIKELRQEGHFTIPCLLEDELKTNPFLRPNDNGIRQQLNMQEATDLEVFAEIRARKDVF